MVGITLSRLFAHHDRLVQQLADLMNEQLKQIVQRNADAARFKLLARLLAMIDNSAQEKWGEAFVLLTVKRLASAIDSESTRKAELQLLNELAPCYTVNRVRSLLQSCEAIQSSKCLSVQVFSLARFFAWAHSPCDSMKRFTQQPREIALPAHIASAWSAFAQQYQTSHPGGQLVLLGHMGTCKLFDRTKKQTCSASTQTMCIIEALQTAVEALTVQQIAVRTQYSEHATQHKLNTLVKQRFLIGENTYSLNSDANVKRLA